MNCYCDTGDLPEQTHFGVLGSIHLWSTQKCLLYDREHTKVSSTCHSNIRLLSPNSWSGNIVPKQPGYCESAHKDEARYSRSRCQKKAGINFSVDLGFTVSVVQTLLKTLS